MTNKTCEQCAYFWRDGDGYSDYTWMETNARCFIGKHPNLPASIPYMKDGQTWDQMDYAKNCESFFELYTGPSILVTPNGYVEEAGESRVAELLRLASK